MAQAACLPDTTRTDVYMPIPLSTSDEPAFQKIQLYAPLVGSVAAVIFTLVYGMTAGTLVVSLILSLFTGLGVTVGFHRLFTHRSFETVRPVEAVLAVLGSMAAQGTPFSWISSHRQHHRYSDHEGDPHSPNLVGQTTTARVSSFVYSHFGWMLTGHMTPERLSYIPELLADPLLCRIQRLHLLWVASGFVLPAAVCYAIVPHWQAAVSGLLWGGFVRIAATDHVSFAVNSVCHVWGKRHYASRDLSRNNGFVAFLSMGEGWHNNHHAFPTSARHGLRWWQFDASYAVIRLLRGCGLAWNVKTPTPEQLAAKALDAR